MDRTLIYQVFLDMKEMLLAQLCVSKAGSDLFERRAIVRTVGGRSHTASVPNALPFPTSQAN
jgi:hypothetical protein